MQNSVKRAESIRMWNGILRIDGVDVWALEAASLEATFLVSQIKFANAKMPPRKKLDEFTFNATLVELFFDNLVKIDWVGQLEDVVWVLTNVTNEAHGVGWVVGKPFKLLQKNGDNTLVTIATIKANTTTLVAGTDYNTYVGDGDNGEKWYTYIVPLTAQTLAITANYSYTPNASKKITYDDLIRLLSFYEVEFYNYDANGKKFGIRIPQGYSSSNLAFEFPKDDDFESYSQIPVSFKWFPGANGRIFELIDEQSVI